MMKQLAVTQSFINQGYRSMSLEEKWSLALKILTYFGGIYIITSISLMGFCVMQIWDVKIQLEVLSQKAPPEWFIQEVKTKEQLLDNKILDLEHDFKLYRDRHPRDPDNG